MKHHPTGLPAAAALLALLANPALAATVTFETVNVSPDGYWNGSDLSGTLSPISDFGESTYNQNRQIEGSGFQNSFTDWGGGSSSWSGFAISNHTDTTTPGFANQYSACAGSGV